MNWSQLSAHPFLQLVDIESVTSHSFMIFIGLLKSLKTLIKLNDFD